MGTLSAVFEHNELIALPEGGYGYKAHFGYNNRGTEAESRPPSSVAPKNNFYKAGTDLGQPSEFAVGRVNDVVAIEYPADQKNLVWTLDNTATGGKPVRPLEMRINQHTYVGETDVFVEFVVRNPNPQRIVAPVGEVNEVNVGDSQPTEFPANTQVSWAAVIPRDGTVTWRIGNVSVTYVGG